MEALTNKKSLTIQHLYSESYHSNPCLSPSIHLNLSQNVNEFNENINKSNITEEPKIFKNKSRKANSLDIRPKDINLNEIKEVKSNNLLPRNNFDFSNNKSIKSIKSLFYPENVTIKQDYEDLSNIHKVNEVEESTKNYKDYFIENISFEYSIDSSDNIDYIEKFHKNENFSYDVIIILLIIIIVIKLE